MICLQILMYTQSGKKKTSDRLFVLEVELDHKKYLYTEFGVTEIQYLNFSWEQAGDLACHLEEKMVPGPPLPTGGNDDDRNHLILPDLYEHLLEKWDQGQGIK